MSNEVCICIPKIDPTINKNLIEKIFNNYDIGPVKKINLIYSKEKKNKLGFIYLKYLNKSKNGLIVSECLEKNEDFKIIYNFPWFWKCYKAKN